jgi:hypothetical protein
MDVKLFDFVIDLILQDNIDSKYYINILNIYENNEITKLFNISNINIDIIDYFKLLKKKYKYCKFNLNNIQYFCDKYNTNLINDNYKINFYAFNNLKSINLKFSYGRCIEDSSISNLYNLEELILHNNKLLSDKGLINLNKLTKLHLKHNTNITNKSIINKNNLEELVLIHNKNINDEGFINITKLKKLNLGYNNNRKLNLEFIKFNPNLEEIHIYKKKKLNINIINIINNINNLVYKINIL